MKLSILICTVHSRTTTYLPKILDKLLPQATKDVEVIWLGDNKRRSVGKKRNDLLRLAQGEYVVFVDDDDMVTDDYVVTLLMGTASKADVINFQVMCSVNGGEYKPVYYNAEYRMNKNFSDRYERLPNHIMCIKRDLAIKAGFPEKNMGEDDDFAKNLRPLLKTQSFIDKPLYYYTFSHQVSETQ